MRTTNSYIGPCHETASKRAHDQVQPVPLSHLAPESHESPTKKRRARSSDRDKFLLAFDYITRDLGLSISHFLWELFLYEDGGTFAQRTPSHDSAVSLFLSGHAKYTVGQVLAQILKFPAATPPRRSQEMKTDMFSLSKSWTDVKHAKSALTTLAVSLVSTHLITELESVVEGSSGLHGSVPPPNRGRTRSIGWMDISKETPSIVQGIFQQHSPVTLHLLEGLVTREDRRGGTVQPRKMRPSLIVRIFIFTLAFLPYHSSRLLPRF